MVHGVTTEECQAALQSHAWSVQKAAQYLKVSAPVPGPETAAVPSSALAFHPA